jgi:hypothetical protein
MATLAGKGGYRTGQGNIRRPVFKLIPAEICVNQFISFDIFLEKGRGREKQPTHLPLPGSDAKVNWG